MKNTVALFSDDRKLLLWGIVVLVAVLIAVMIFPSVECFFMSLTGIKTKPELIKLMGWGMSGVIAIFGVMGLLQRAAALDKQNEMTEKGHIHERFKAAIEHLGIKRVSVRISSFYEFYRLAEIESDLKEPIFNILCAHLRKSTKDENYQKEIQNRGDTLTDADIAEHKKIEMQILLDILFKEHKDKLIFDGLVANLEGADLPGVNLQNAKLQKANLKYVNLRKAILFGANLQNARLLKADLRGTIMESCDRKNMENPPVKKVDLHNAKLYGAKIDEDTQMPDGWKDVVKKDMNGKTSVRRVDEGKIIEIL